MYGIEKLTLAHLLRKSLVEFELFPSSDRLNHDLLRSGGNRLADSSSIGIEERPNATKHSDTA